MIPIHKLRTWERDLRIREATGFASEAERASARSFMFWIDHGFLRKTWTNFEQIAPGAFRSNQPDLPRLKKWKAMGIETVLTLRGGISAAPVLLEREACAELGMRLYQIGLASRFAPPRDRLLELIALFDTIERPFAMHCKSGADRAGLASAIYLITQEGQSVEQARRMLSFRYLHVKASRTGILDRFVDVYEARNRDRPIGLADWIATEYDPEAMQAEFDAERGRR